jgi:hypothetical protein
MGRLLLETALARRTPCRRITPAFFSAQHLVNDPLKFVWFTASTVRDKETCDVQNFRPFFRSILYGFQRRFLDFVSGLSS